MDAFDAFRALMMPHRIFHHKGFNYASVAWTLSRLGEQNTQFLIWDYTLHGRTAEAAVILCEYVQGEVVGMSFTQLDVWVSRWERMWLSGLITSPRHRSPTTAG
jgi:hypothetical protein